MAKIFVAGKAIVIRSAFKYEDFETIEKYRKESLTLKDSDGNPVFAVKTGCRPSANSYGIVFDGKSQDGNAQLTIVVDEEPTVDYISDTYGTAVLNLNKVEDGMQTTLREIEVEKATIASNIEIA